MLVTVISITKLYFHLVLPLILETDEDFSERCAEAHIIFLKKPNYEKSTESMTLNSFKISHGTAKPTPSTMMSSAWHAGDTTVIISQRHEIGQVRYERWS